MEGALHALVSRQRALPLIVVHGPAATGKSAAVRRVLEGKPHTVINCQFYDDFKRILQPIASRLGVDSHVADVRELAEQASRIKQEAPVYIVLDRADALLSIDRKSFFLLCRLRQFLPSQMVGIILVTRKGWAEFGSVCTNLHPRIVESAASPDPGRQLLQELAHADLDPDHLRCFLDQVLQMTKMQHNDLSYTVSLMKKAYADYKALGSKSLVRTEFSRLLNAKEVSEASAMVVELLSEVEQYVLMASYLASRIPPKKDVKVFGVIAKKGRYVKRPKSDQQLEERTHAASAERLLAIFYMIYASGRVAPSRSVVLGAVQQLVKTRLLLRLTPMARLDAFKFRCNVAQATVNVLAKKLNFSYGSYLAYEA